MNATLIRQEHVLEMSIGPQSWRLETDRRPPVAKCEKPSNQKLKTFANKVKTRSYWCNNFFCFFSFFFLKPTFTLKETVSVSGLWWTCQFHQQWAVFNRNYGTQKPPGSNQSNFKVITTTLYKPPLRQISAWQMPETTRKIDIFPLATRGCRGDHWPVSCPVRLES